MRISSASVLTAASLFAVSMIGTVTGCSKKKEDPASQGFGAIAGKGSDGSAAEPPKQVKLPPAKPAAPLGKLAPDTGGATGKVKWQRAFGGMGSDLIRALDVSADGTILAAGYFEGSGDVSFRDQTQAKPAGLQSNGDADALVAAIGNDGHPRWLIGFGGSKGDTATDVAANDQGALVVGNFADEMTIKGVGGKEFTAKSNGSDDLYALFLDAAGKPQWLFSMGGKDSDGANSVAKTPDGGWIIGGSFGGTFTVGGTTLTSAGRTDALLVKLDGQGTVQWIHSYGGLYDDLVAHVAVDVAGNIIVQGQFANQVDWGGGILKGGGGSDADVLLAKYDGNGNHVWSKNFGGAFNEVAGGIAIDVAGNIAMTGSFDQVINFGAGEIKVAGESDIFVAKFTNDGTLTWAKSFGGIREDIGYNIASDASGNTFITGWFFGKMNLDGRELSGAQKDVMVAKLDPAGKVLWATSFGDRDLDQGRAICVDAAGAPYIAGVYRFGLNALSPAIESLHGEEKAPKADVFIVGLER